MIRSSLNVWLVLAALAPTLAQEGGDGLPPPARPAAAATGSASPAERVLAGHLDYVTDRNPFRLGDYWLVADDGSRIRLEKSETLRQLSHGWLRNTRIEARAELTPEGTARLVEALDPRVLEVRARVLDEGGKIVLETAAERLTVVDENPRYDYGTGPDLAKHMVGQTIKARVFAFRDGTAWLNAVEARARKRHFLPFVFHPGIIIPWWKPAGEAYWVHYWDAERGPAIGRLNGLDTEDFEFDVAAPIPASPSAGLTGALKRVGD